MENLDSNKDSQIAKTPAELAQGVEDAEVDTTEFGHKKTEPETGPGTAPVSGDRTNIRIFHGRPGGGTTSFGGTSVEQV